MKEKDVPQKKIEKILDILIETKKEYGMKIAYKTKNDVCITYNQVYGDISALGSYIYEVLDIHKSNVGLISENSYYADIVTYTCIFGDNILCNIDEDIKIYELENIIRKANLKIVFYSSKISGKIDEIKNKFKKIKFIILSTENNEFSVKNSIDEGINILRSGVNTYMDLKESKEDNKICLVDNDKIRYLKAKNIVSYLESIRERIELSSEDIYISTLHASNNGELLISKLIKMYLGITLIYPKSSDIIKTIKEEKITTALLDYKAINKIYDSIYKYIAKNNKEKKIERLNIASKKLNNIPRKIKKGICKDILRVVGVSLDKIIVLEKIEKNKIKLLSDIGIIIITGYSSKNKMPLISLSKVNNGENIESNGIPLSNIDVSVRLQNDDGHGEIFVKGDFTNEYISTEDVGYIDDVGKIHVIGKKKNQINLESGAKIYPEYIEEKLKEIHNVKDANVYLRKISGKLSLFANVSLAQKYCIKNTESNGITIYNVKTARKMSKRERKQNKINSIEKMIKRDNRKYIKEEIEKINNSISRYNKIIDFEIVEDI